MGRGRTGDTFKTPFPWWAISALLYRFRRVSLMAPNHPYPNKNFDPTLDLSWGNIGKFFSKQKNLPCQKNFLVLFARNFILTLENSPRIRTFFLKLKFFLARKGIIVIRSLFLFWGMVLKSSQVFLLKKQEKFSQWDEFSCFERKHSNNFLI